MKSVADLKKDSILVIAAEASSCMYAKNFINQWKAFSPDTHFFGVGDKEMQSQGMECFGLAEDMAVVGLLEVIKHYPEIRQCADSILEKVEKNPPRFALLLDYPGFNLRLAKKLKELNVPVVYYISPQLWAWKKGRVHQVKKFVDHMLVVFPFEVDFYKEFGIEAHFIGHPLVEVVDDEKKKLTVPEKSLPVLGLMPGSRKSEIQYNLAIQLKAAEKLAGLQKVKVKLLLAPTLRREDIQPYLDATNLEYEILQKAPTQMIHECDYILTASGTATLQVALCEKPMVVMYRMNPVTALMAKFLVRSVDAFCIVNLIAGKKIVPELFQGEASAENLAKHLESLMVDLERRNTMLKDFSEVKHKLGKGGATQNLVQFLKGKFL